MARGLRGKRVVVAGLGRSGLSAVRLLVREGAQVTATDLRAEASFPEAARTDLSALAASGVRLELGGHVASSFTGADLVVKSPGIPPSVPEIVAARQAGVPVIGEVELCAPFLSGPVVAITGTNGKSTTTALLGHLLASAGRRPFVGGNLGVPVAEHVSSGEGADAVVLELSSYQIDDLDAFEADVAVVLNLTPDHLERYGSMEAYAASKARLLGRVRASGTCVLNADSPPLAAMREHVGARRLVTFGAGDAAAGQLRSLGATVFRGTDERYEIRARTLRGSHNVENAMAAIEVARLLGVLPEAVQAGLDSYPGLSHRLEVVRTIDGVEWINDSKATNVDSVEKSLSAIDGPLHVVMGGKGKGASYEPLRPLFPGRVKRLYLVGEDADAIARELGDLAPVEHAKTLDVAVTRAHANAVSGETVLLSPACASFDQFTSFEHRGETFRRLVEALRPEVSHAAC